MILIPILIDILTVRYSLGRGELVKMNETITQLYSLKKQDLVNQCSEHNTIARGTKEFMIRNILGVGVPIRNESKEVYQKLSTFIDVVHTNHKNIPIDALETLYNHLKSLFTLKKSELVKMATTKGVSALGSKSTLMYHLIMGSEYKRVETSIDKQTILKALTVSQLAHKCKTLGIPHTGKKECLLERLKQYNEEMKQNPFIKTIPLKSFTTCECDKVVWIHEESGFVLDRKKLVIGRIVENRFRKWMPELDIPDCRFYRFEW